MNSVSYAILCVSFICLIAVSVFYFYPSQESITEPDKKIGVIVTIVPQAEFVEKIGADKVSVVILVPPGASPHTYEPTPSQMQKVAKAKIYAKVGSGIEFELTWMDKIIATNPDMIIIDCSKSIELIGITSQYNEHELEMYENQNFGRDPHIWTSPRNAKIMVENICNGLIELDPSNKKYYAQNKDAYINDLEETDRKLSNSFSGLKVRKFMVYHPTWGYFAKDYELEQIPIEEEGKEPNPEGIAYLIDQAKENNIKVIFATPEFQTDIAETIAGEIGGTVVLVSPLEKDYISTLTKISDEIARSLN
ncbi:MAG: zinc ABC transporter substrate-binding protein [Candidatus Bathyarchaeota archaeon]|nr:zinc ABC transporter substrate-binding protein [Candidatus Bathyarchaeota archaeon]